MLYLNNKALSLIGLIELFKKEVLDLTEPELPAPSLLTRFRKKLASIYFSNEKEAICREMIEVDGRFATYPELKEVLVVMFGLEDKAAIQAQLSTIRAREFDPGLVETQWERLNGSLGYFKDEALLPLFTELAQACRAMSVLVEENLADEDMPYIYAYRLMVLFVSQTTRPSFENIAKKTYALLEQQEHGQFNKPYHDVILNQIQLPPRKAIGDLDGWLALLNSKISISFLPYFAMAPQIEGQIKNVTEQYKAPKDLREAKAMAARCYYTRASEKVELAELCRAYNIPENGDECSFNKCLDYFNSLPKWPMKDSDNLPHPVTIGVGAAEGYCWVKLPTDDLRALILGRITACCQSIGGHSEQCVKDAISLSDNGLYVLLKRKDKADHASQPYIGNRINDANFEIVGQSYAWISKTGNLTLDSLESSIGRVTTSVAKALLTQFADTVLSEKPSIKRITLGVGGGTPQNLDFAHTFLSETIRLGFQYGDSSRQFCVSRQKKIADEQFTALMTKLNINGEVKEVLHYLSDYLSDTSNFEAELTKLLAVTPDLHCKLTPHSLFRLLSFTTTPALNDLLPFDFDRLKALSEEDRKKELSQISTARLVLQVMGPEQFLNTLDYIPLAQHYAAFQAHKGILHWARGNLDLLQALLDKYPEELRFQAIKEKNGYGDTVLHQVAMNPEFLKAILMSLSSEEARLEAIKEKSGYGDTILHQIARYPESLKAILMSLSSEEARLEAIKEKNEHGRDTTLHRAARYSESLKAILMALPEKLHFEVIKEKNGGGCTVLHIAAQHEGIFSMLLEKIPSSELIAMVLDKDATGKTVFDYLSSVDSLYAILNVLPQKSLNELPPEILMHPTVAQYRVQQELKSSITDVGLFKPVDEDEKDGSLNTPKPS